MVATSRSVDFAGKSATSWSLGNQRMNTRRPDGGGPHAPRTVAAMANSSPSSRVVTVTDNWDLLGLPTLADEPITPFLAIWLLVIIPLVPGLLDGSLVLLGLGACMSVVAVVMSITALADLDATRDARRVNRPVPHGRVTGSVGRTRGRGRILARRHAARLRDTEECRDNGRHLVRRPHLECRAALVDADREREEPAAPLLCDHELAQAFPRRCHRRTRGEVRRLPWCSEPGRARGSRSIPPGGSASRSRPACTRSTLRLASRPTHRGAPDSSFSRT